MPDVKIDLDEPVPQEIAEIVNAAVFYAFAAEIRAKHVRFSKRLGSGTQRGWRGLSCKIVMENLRSRVSRPIEDDEQERARQAALASQNAQDAYEVAEDRRDEAERLEQVYSRQKQAAEMRPFRPVP